MSSILITFITIIGPFEGCLKLLQDNDQVPILFKQTVILFIILLIYAKNLNMLLLLLQKDLRYAAEKYDVPPTSLYDSLKVLRSGKESLFK